MLKNLDWPDGQTNASGIKPIAYAIRKVMVKKFPKLAEGGVAYDGDFDLADGAKFITIYTTQGKGKVGYDQTGEKDCRMFTNKASLSFPDLSDAAGVLAVNTINSNLLVIVPHYEAGNKVRYAVFGSEHFDATTDCKGDSGDAPGSAKATTIEITAPDFVPLPSYSGLIPLDSGTLNCATGVTTPAPAPAPAP